MSTPKIDPEFKALIPPLSDDERADLEANLKTWGGAREPLVEWNGLLLDGHNRFEICQRLGLHFEVTSAPFSIDTRDDAKIWIIDNQKGRRNLPPFVRIELEAERARILAARAKANQAAGGREKVRQNSDKAIDVKRDIASATGTSHDTVHKARTIIDRAPEPIKEAVRRQELSIHAGYEATKALERLPEEKRAEVLARVAADDRKDVKRAIGEVKLEAKRALAEEIRANPVVTPDGRYQVIVSDPPWKYDARAEDTTHRGKNQYPDMTVEEICALPVASLAQDDCVLWLWTTNAFMRDAYRCLDAWGFREKTILTWDKELIGLGDWLRNVTEHCILAVRGKPIVSLTNQTTIIREKRREHSRKPDAFYQLVEALCPGSKLEMFSRTPRDGWAAWGAETEKFDAAQ